MQKITLIILGLVLVALALFVNERVKAREKPNSPAAPTPVPTVPTRVTAMKVQRVPHFRTGISENGSIEAVDQVVLRSKVSGRLEKLLVAEGDPVEVGQALAILDQDETRARLAVAEANLTVTGAQLKESEVSLADARREAKRYEQLFKDGFCTEQEKTQRQTTLLSAEATQARIKASIAAVKAEIDRIKVDLNEATIRASISGVVADDFSHTIGEMITTQTDLVELVNPSRLYARVYIPEQDSHRINENMSVEITALADRQIPHIAKVWRIQPIADPETRTTRVDVLIQNPGNLKPGQFATVFFIEQDIPNATVIPANAITLNNQTPYVWIAQGSTAQRQAITVGPKRDNEICVQGLEAESVLISGTNNLTEGDPVQVTLYN